MLNPNATLNRQPMTCKPGRVARWLSDSPAEALASGHGALLQLTVPRKVRGEYKMLDTFYVILPICGGYQMLREEEGKIVERYAIDTAFGDADYWQCDCPVGVFHQECGGEKCKHAAGLAAALKRAGAL